MSHTPGPWKQWPKFVLGIDITADDDKRREFASSVCTVEYDDRQPHGTLDANARLIASAPELLAACRAIVLADLPSWEGTVESRRLVAVNQAKAAIAKAEGK